MQNIMFQISCYFPQLALVCKLINDDKKIVILDDWIVKMCLHVETSSYYRGMDSDKHPLMANMTWALGFIRTLQLIKDEKIRTEIIEQFQNENGVYMLHPNIFLQENEMVNAKTGNNSFINKVEYYSLLPDRMKLLYSYESACGFYSNEISNRLEGRVNNLEIENAKLKVFNSWNFTVGRIILFIPKLFISPFRMIFKMLVKKDGEKRKKSR